MESRLLLPLYEVIVFEKRRDAKKGLPNITFFNVYNEKISTVYTYKRLGDFNSPGS